MSTEMEVDAPETGPAAAPSSAGMEQDNSNDKLSVLVQKPIPYTFDLGNLLVSDPNPLPNPSNPSNDEIASAARDCAQALINQLLTTCPITKSSTAGDGSAGELLITLPPSTTPLPREKPLPEAKPETRWEKFARQKGIANKRRDERGRMVYDEEKGDWVPRWGYKGKNKDAEEQWLVEVDEKKEREAEEQGATVRSLARRERKEAVRRNERKQRANDRRGRKAASGGD